MYDHSRFWPESRHAKFALLVDISLKWSIIFISAYYLSIDGHHEKNRIGAQTAYYKSEKKI